MSTELTMLGWSVVLLLVQIVLQAATSSLDLGLPYAMSARDEGRKPTEVLTFLGLEKGMRVADMFGGNLYWSEIMAPAVGPDGMVVIWNPNQFFSAKTQAGFDAFHAKHPNTILTHTPFEAPVLSEGFYDFLLMNLDYHDTYWSSEKNKIPVMDPGEFVKEIYDAMKPGAVVGIIDHVADAGGDTRAVVEKLHRIDPAVVKADFERAGFVLEGESDLLRNPADDHKANVFDAAIRGKTDRFVFKFRKPQ